MTEPGPEVECDLTIQDTPHGRVVYVLPTIPDDAPDRLREGVARRRIVTLAGECPCGARMVLPNRQQRREAARRGVAVHTECAHEHGCPAVDDTLDGAFKQWLR